MVDHHVAERHQMAGGQSRTVPLVHRHRRPAGELVTTHDDHRLGGRRLRQRVHGVTRRRDHDVPVDVGVMEVVERSSQITGIHVTQADERDPVVMVASGRLDAEQRVRGTEVRRLHADHTEHPRAAPREGPGGGVGTIAQCLDGPFDPLAGLRSHRGIATEHPGDRHA
jgi:hypothetical protein